MWGFVFGGFWGGFVGEGATARIQGRLMEGRVCLVDMRAMLLGRRSRGGFSWCLCSRRGLVSEAIRRKVAALGVLGSGV